MSDIFCECCAFEPIDPGETRVLTFAFANGLAEGETLVSAELIIDAPDDPAASTKFSSTQINGSDVLVAVFDCVDGTYNLRVRAPTSNFEKVLVIGNPLVCRQF